MITNFNLNSLLYISEGIITTLEYTLTSVLLGFIGGLLLSLARISHNTALNVIARIYVSIFRGTPLLVQLYLIYFIIPQLAYELLNQTITLSVFAAGIIALSMNSAAYVAENIRAGIQSVPKGQFEGAKALGIPYVLMMKDIILPQALRNALPSLVNEIVNLLKETAIISVLGGLDIMRRAQVIMSETYDYLTPLLIAAGCYYILIFICSSIANYVEKRVSNHD